MPDLGASLRDLIDRSTAPVDVDGIVRARRRRRRRRRTGAAAAVLAAVVAVAVAGAVMTRSAPPHEVVAVSGPRPVAEADATREALGALDVLSPGGGSSALVGSGPSTIGVTDAATGHHRSVPFPVPDAQSIVYPFLVLGPYVVFAVDAQTGPYDPAIGTAYVASSDFAVWRALGPASSYVPSVDGSGVWLSTDNATPDQRLHGTEYGTVRTVTEFALDGTRRTTTYPLTDRRAVLAATPDGLLTSRPLESHPASPVYEVWDPATDRVVRTLDIPSGAVDASSHYVAWTSATCAVSAACRLHVTDVATGRSRTFAPPAGMQWTERAFSPDGSRIAVVAAPPPSREEMARDVPPGYVPPGTQTAEILTLDLATGKPTSASARVWKGRLSPAWSPDGSLVFFAVDRGHVGYVNTAYPDGPVRTLSVAGADAFLVAEQPAAPAADAPRYSYDGEVSASAQHSAELCVYPTAAVLRPGRDDCSGPPVVGWDRPNGRWHLAGTYDGHVFTLTQPPSDASAPTAPPGGTAPEFKTPCAPPPGGWRVTDASHVSLDDYNAVTNAARSAPDFAGLWLDQSTAPGTVNDIPHDVINVAFTGAIDEHRRALEALWGGPICVIRRPHPYAELQRIAHELIGPAGRELGLQVFAAGPDDALDQVVISVVATDAATQQKVDARYGSGVVRIESSLQPVA